MSAAFQRVTLLLRRRMLSIFLDKVRFWTSSRKHLSSPYLTENKHMSPGGQIQCECSGTPRATIPAAPPISAGAAGAWLPGSAQSKVSQIFSFYCQVSLSFINGKKIASLQASRPHLPLSGKLRSQELNQCERQLEPGEHEQQHEQQHGGHLELDQQEAPCVHVFSCLLWNSCSISRPPLLLNLNYFIHTFSVLLIFNMCSNTFILITFTYFSLKCADPLFVFGTPLQAFHMWKAITKKGDFFTYYCDILKFLQRKISSKHANWKQKANAYKFGYNHSCSLPYALYALYAL